MSLIETLRSRVTVASKTIPLKVAVTQLLPGDATRKLQAVKTPTVPLSVSNATARLSATAFAGGKTVTSLVAGTSGARLSRL